MSEPNSSPDCELTILMPCLNEAETLAVCIDKARAFIDQHNLHAEVLIADNGSTDGSQKIAEQHGARVIPVAARGYGAALKGGIAAARGRYIIMGDADDSYDFSALAPYLEKLRAGYELVMGNRFKGGIAPGAMPPLHRYLGNPVLSGIGRMFFSSSIGDFHCGLRGFSKAAIDKLSLQTEGMEFASEMVVKATLYQLKICEVPTTLSPDGRTRPPHLRSWRDGWRHLRFLLLYSPRWLFLYPGLLLSGLGLFLLLWLLPGARHLGGVTFDIHTMLYGAAMFVTGVQSISFALFTKVFAIRASLVPPQDRFLRGIEQLTLERGLITGILLILASGGATLYGLSEWGNSAYGPLQPSEMMRITIPAVTALIAGMQIALSSFFLGVLGLTNQPE